MRSGEDRAYWNPKNETLPRGEIRALQERKLRALVRTLAERSSFYRRKFTEAKVDPDSIRTLDDLRRLPTSDKEDHKRSQQEHPPYGDIHLVDVKACSRLHGSPGRAAISR